MVFALQTKTIKNVITKSSITSVIGLLSFLEVEMIQFNVDNLKAKPSVTIEKVKEEIPYPKLYNPERFLTRKPHPNSHPTYLKGLGIVKQISENLRPIEHTELMAYDTSFRTEVMKILDQMNIPNQWVRKLYHELEYLIVIEKYRHNKPRPFILGPHLGVEITPIHYRYAESPSYPSGHAMQAYLVSEIVKNLLNLSDLDTISSRVCLSRMQAGVHFPCDVLEGMRIAKNLAKYLIDTYGKAIFDLTL